MRETLTNDGEFEPGPEVGVDINVATMAVQTNDLGLNCEPVEAETLC